MALVSSPSSPALAPTGYRAPPSSSDAPHRATTPTPNPTTAFGAGRRVAPPSNGRGLAPGGNGSSRVPVPPLLGNGRNGSTTPPVFADPRNRTSSVPSMSSYAYPARASSTPAPHARSTSTSQPSSHQNGNYAPGPYPSQQNPNQFGYAHPHPQYPFIPSPHPNGHLGAFQAGGQNYSPFPPQDYPTLQQQQQQHQARLNHQAQYQQEQLQLEMIRNHNAANGGQIEWNQRQGQNGQPRRRTTSGPAAGSAPGQQYAHGHPGYPPSPSLSPTHHAQLSLSSMPSLPPGAMVPQFPSGYPTPPGSVEGRDGPHPYRRAKEEAKPTVQQQHQGLQQQRMQGSTQHGSSSSSSSNSNSSSAQSHARTDSTASSLSTQNFPPLPKSPAVIPVPLYTHNGPSSGSRSESQPSSTRSTPPTTPVLSSPLRSRTSSQSSIPSAPPAPRSTHERERTAPTDSTRSASSQQLSIVTSGSAMLQGKKPGPLSQQVRTRSTTPSSDHDRDAERERERPGTPGTTRGQRSMHDSEEDSDDTALATRVAPNAAAKEKKGMRYKLKKAFSINSGLNTRAEADPIVKAPVKLVRPESTYSVEPSSSPYLRQNTTSTASLRPDNEVPTLTRRSGVLNSKLNASTDNISISSTVSSASVMIRKLGQLGKLARRNSLMSLTRAFKGKPKEEEKGSATTAQVAHVTVELDATPSPTKGGMSPAAALAKRHQQQYAEQEAVAIARTVEPMRSFDVQARTGEPAKSQSRSRSSEDLLELTRQEKERVMNDSLSKAKKGRRWGFGSSSDLKEAARAPTPLIPYEPFSPLSTGDDEESLERFDPRRAYEVDDGYESSLNGHAPPPDPRRDARPARGILKGAGTYNQEDYALPRPAFPRSRANSAQQVTSLSSATPSPGESLLPSSTPVTPFEEQLDRISTSPSVTNFPTWSPEPVPSPYVNPAYNYSAPVLQSAPLHPPTLRSATMPNGPARRISFAQNLSVHTTWPAAIYDRRAEPAACNRLTPSFAQRIKEELNAFKMEEMDVHPLSRQLTHFFV